MKQLLPRVLQVPWPVSGAIPFHFARGLVCEAQGMDVNWAEFGFKMTHPHQSTSGIPRVLPEYANLELPLVNIRKVIPPFVPQVSIGNITETVHESA